MVGASKWLLSDGIQENGHLNDAVYIKNGLWFIFDSSDILAILIRASLLSFLSPFSHFLTLLALLFAFSPFPLALFDFSLSPRPLSSSLFSLPPLSLTLTRFISFCSLYSFSCLCCTSRFLAIRRIFAITVMSLLANFICSQTY